MAATDWSDNDRPPFLRIPPSSPGKILRSLLNQSRLTIAPGAPDPLTARLIEHAGFSMVYLTGAGLANVHLGVPDVGLVSMDEALRVTRATASVVGIPVLADVDTGFGNALGVARTVREFERAGAAGIQLEDQVSPKRCGHFDGKDVIPVEEMVAKLHAARLARLDPAFVIVARTDAAQPEGLDAALQRARQYVEAGADAIFVEAPLSQTELARVSHEVSGIPLVANMVEGGKTPIQTAEMLERLGFSLVIYANFPLRAAMHAVTRALAHLRDTGSSLGFESEIASWTERQTAVGLAEVQALESRLAELGEAT